MSTKQRRDNAYYEQRLKKEAPLVYRKWKTGGYESMRSARRDAGLLTDRTPLQKIRSAWQRLTLKDRALFLQGLSAEQRGQLKTRSLTRDGCLLDWTRKRVLTIMGRRDLKHGALMGELGLSRNDQSLSMAIARGTRINIELETALRRWLIANAEV